MATLLLAVSFALLGSIGGLVVARWLGHARLLAPLKAAARDEDGLFVAALATSRGLVVFPVYAHADAVARLRSLWLDRRCRLFALEAFRPDDRVHQTAVRFARAALAEGRGDGLPLPPQGVLQMAELYIQHAGNPAALGDVTGPSGTFIVRTIRAPGA
jgi:hypothetical protein